jgi:biopolymer transport protein ExbD
MCDIVFLLLLYFLLLGNFKRDTAINVDIPTSKTPTQICNLVSSPLLYFDFSQKGDLFVTSENNTKRYLSKIDMLEKSFNETIKTILLENPGTKIIINGDQNLKYKDFNKLYAALQLQHINKISLLVN